MHVLEGHDGAVLDVAISNDNTVIVSGGSDKKVILWVAKQGLFVRCLNGHSKGVSSVSFSNDEGSSVIVSFSEVFFFVSVFVSV